MTHGKTISQIATECPPTKTCLFNFSFASSYSLCAAFLIFWSFACATCLIWLASSFAFSSFVSGVAAAGAAVAVAAAGSAGAAGAAGAGVF